VNQSAVVSGAEGFLLRLLERLDRSRFEPTLVCSAEGELTQRARELDVPVRVWPMPPYPPTFSNAIPAWSRLRRFRRWLSELSRAEKFALLHANDLPAQLWAGAVARRIGLPEVFSQYRILKPSLRSKIAVRCGARNADRLIAVSEAVRDNLVALGAAREKIVVMPNTISPEPSKVSEAQLQAVREELGAPGDTPFVVMVGVVTPWKGQHVFVEAAAAVLAQGSQARFAVVGGPVFGDEAYFAQLKARAAALRIEKALVFTGHRRDVPAILAAADFVVHASVLPDPCPTVLMEAMAAGKAVIGANAGGAPEIVVEGATGLLFPPGNAQALAQAIQRLLADSALRQQMGEAGRRRLVERFNIEDTVASIQALYDELLGRSSGASKCA
jgi:glycosyltransferase involved in cell wall biosynthesis